jgi:hypothetical protein
MALYKFTQPVVFAQGLNQDTDDKLATTELITAENVVMSKLGKLDVRNGYEQLNNKIYKSTQPLNKGEMLVDFDDELLLFTTSNLYTYTANEWYEKAQKTTITSTTSSLHKSTIDVEFHRHTISPDGVELLTYSNIDSGVVYFDVIKDNVKLAFKNKLDINISAIEVIFKSGYFFILYIKNNNLYLRTILYSRPTELSSSILLKEGVKKAIQLYNYSSKWITIFTVDSSTNELIGVYCDREGVLATPADRLPAMTTFPEVLISDFLQVFVSTDVYPTYWILTNTESNSKLHQIDHNFIVQNIPVTLHEFKIDVATGMQLGNQLDIYTSVDKTIYKRVVDITNLGSISTSPPIEVIRSVSLVSNIFKYNNRSFCLVSYDSIFQPSYFILDCDSGKIEGRLDYLTGGGKTSYLYQVYNFNNSYVVTSKTITKTTIGNNKYEIHNGLDKHTFDFTTPRNYQAESFNGLLHVGGSVPHIYDGTNYVEHGFLIYPEEINCEVVDKYVTRVLYTNMGVADLEDFDDDDGFVRFEAELFGEGVYGDLDKDDEIVYYKWYTEEDALLSENRVLNAYNKVGFKDVIKCRMFVESGGVLQLIGEHVISFTFRREFVAATDHRNNSGKLTGNTTYFYQAVYAWTDSQGNLHRSAPTLIPFSIDIPDGKDAVKVTIPTLQLTKKTDVAIEIYRSEALGSVNYLVTSVTNNPELDFIEYIDETPDTTLVSKERLYTSGGVLDNNSVASCKYMTIHQNRLFIGGLRDVHSIQYSHETAVGYPSEFSDFFITPLPIKHSITALKSFGDLLFIFTENSIGILVGQGADMIGAGGNYRFEFFSRDVGCISFQSIVETNEGLYFQSKKGIYTIRKGGVLEFIGRSVKDYSDIITSALTVPGENEVRFYTNTVTLVYNEQYQVWSTFTNMPTISAVIYKQSGFRLSIDGSSIFKDTDVKSDAGSIIPFKIQSGWVTAAQLQGVQRIYRINIVGSRIDYHKVKITLYYDYNKSVGETFIFDSDDIQRWGGSTWDDSFFSGLDDNAYVYGIRPRQQKCSAFSLEIELISLENEPTEGFSLNYIAVEAGVGRGINKTGRRAKPSYKH